MVSGVFTSINLFMPKLGYQHLNAVVMLGISYGAKYATKSSRETFTSRDQLQYIAQSFIWPGAWPSLERLLGAPETLQPPAGTVLLLQPIAEAVAGLSF